MYKLLGVTLCLLLGVTLCSLASKCTHGYLNEFRLCVDLCKNWRPFSWKAQVFEWIVEKCRRFLSNCEWKVVF
jgi:hypothetical protein